MLSVGCWWPAAESFPGNSSQLKRFLYACLSSPGHALIQWMFHWGVCGWGNDGVSQHPFTLVPECLLELWDQDGMNKVSFCFLCFLQVLCHSYIPMKLSCKHASQVTACGLLNRSDRSAWPKYSEKSMSIFLSFSMHTYI